MFKKKLKFMIIMLVIIFANAKVSAAETGTISFGQTRYSCNVGQTISALIETSGNTTSTVSSYNSADTNIATVADSTDLIPRCINCKMINITCIAAGSTTLQATSSTGATTSVPLAVTNDAEETISFDRANYSCNVGQTISALITASGTSSVASYNADDTSIATMANSTDLIPRCINCRMVDITCKKAGNTRLQATSSAGATGTANLTVTETGEQETISFEKSSYSCEVGKTFETLITASGSETSTVASYGTSDSNIASIDTNTKNQVRCLNCLNVRVVCKNNGTVELNATSSTGATTTSNLTVTQKSGATTGTTTSTTNPHTGENVLRLVGLVVLLVVSFGYLIDYAKKKDDKHIG